MRTPTRRTSLPFLTPLLLTAAPLAAQDDLLLQLSSGAPLVDRFRVDTAGILVATGVLGAKTLPVSGAGVRLIWDPSRAVFRAGGVDGTQWNATNLGAHSFAAGRNTRASALRATALGDGTVASGEAATALGLATTASGYTAFTTGFQNVASGVAAAAFGRISTASGFSSFAAGNPANATGWESVAIGSHVRASGTGSMALGIRASAEHAGSFVGGSTTTGGSHPSDTVKSVVNADFTVRAMGGIRLFTNQAMSAGVYLNPGGSTWNTVSDRRRKEGFAEVDGEDLLLRLGRVPVTSWSYIAEGPDVRHIGPMAQDWHAAFALSADSLTINQGDLDGVNLAAVQALTARTDALRAENEALRARVERLEDEIRRALRGEGER